MKQSLKKQEQAEAIARLHELVKPGQRVYTVLRTVSRSGMSRKIDVYTFDKAGEKRYLSYLVAQAVDMRQDTSGAIIVGGCGMDMGFHLIYTLSRVLYRDGFRCVGKGCDASDHYNEGTPRDGRTKHKTDGGYALKQEWI